MTLLVDTSASRALGFARYVRIDARAGRRRWRERTATGSRSRSSRSIRTRRRSSPAAPASSATRRSKRCSRAAPRARRISGRRSASLARSRASASWCHRRRDHRRRRRRRAASRRSSSSPRQGRAPRRRARRRHPRRARSRRRSSRAGLAAHRRRARSRHRPRDVAAGLGERVLTDVAVEVPGATLGLSAHDQSARAEPAHDGLRAARRSRRRRSRSRSAGQTPRDRRSSAARPRWSSARSRPREIAELEGQLDTATPDAARRRCAPRSRSARSPRA